MAAEEEIYMKLNYKRTVLIGLAFLSISAFWQMYDNVIPLILKNTFGLGETVTRKKFIPLAIRLLIIPTTNSALRLAKF